MKALYTLFFCISFIACKSDSNLSPNALDDSQVLQTIAALPKIDAPEITQNQFKKIEAKVAITGAQVINYVFNLDYYANGRLKTISSTNNVNFSFDYQNTKVNIRNEENDNIINLNSNGLADYIQGDNSQYRFYFKNDFLIQRSDKSGESNNYSTKGNLLSRTGSTTAQYEYTEFVNNIRQEVIGPLAIHWTFRDAYLGKFSTNLIKKAVFNKGKTDESTLNFSYQFDAQSRVTKVSIERVTDNGPGLIEYVYTY